MTTSRSGSRSFSAERRPQAGVAAADDDDVGPQRTLGLRRVAGRLAAKRVDQPERAVRRLAAHRSSSNGSTGLARQNPANRNPPMVARPATINSRRG